jgi:hypothetical protein
MIVQILHSERREPWVNRRPTRQVEKLLDQVELGLAKVERSKRYAENSDSKLRTTWLTDIESMQIMAFASMHILRWVLGTGLLTREMERTFTEPEETGQ